MNPKNVKNIKKNKKSYGEKECDICSDIPDSIIYLSCEHIVCLVCAAKLIFSEKEMDELDFSEITCGVCKEITTLSEEVQETLIEFLNSEDMGGEEDEDEEQEEQNQNSKKKQDSQKKTDSLQTEENLEKNAEDFAEDFAEEEKEDEDEESEVEIVPKNSEEENIYQNKKKNNYKSLNTSHQENYIVDEDDFENENEPENKDNNNYGYEEDDLEEENTDEENLQEEEVNLNIECETHITEICMYYNSKSEKIYCAQCLIDEKIDKREMVNIKSLKKSYPDILQTFQDMINQIETQKNLFLNKKKDFDIRRDNCQNQFLSYYKKFEFNFNEIIDVVENHKNVYLKNFENFSNDTLVDINKNEMMVDGRLGFYDGVLEEVSDLKQNSNDFGEEIFKYYFNNQKKINLNLKKDSTRKEINDNKVYDDFDRKIRSKKDELFYQSIKSIMNKLDKKDIYEEKKKNEEEIEAKFKILNKPEFEKENLFRKTTSVFRERILRNQNENELLKTNLDYNLRKTNLDFNYRNSLTKYNFQRKYNLWKKNDYENKNINLKSLDMVRKNQKSGINKKKNDLNSKILKMKISNNNIVENRDKKFKASQSGFLNRCYNISKKYTTKPTSTFLRSNRIYK